MNKIALANSPTIKSYYHEKINYFIPFTLIVR